MRGYRRHPRILENAKTVDFSICLFQPLNKRPIMQNNHFDHIDRDGSLRSERKDRQRLGKRSSVGSHKGKYSLNHRVRKKSHIGEDDCVSNMKIFLQCYNVFILVSLILNFWPERFVIYIYMYF